MPTIKYGANLVLIGPSPSDSDHLGKMNYLRLVRGFGLSITSDQKSVVGIGSRGEIDRSSFPEKIEGSIEYLISDGVNEKLLGFTVESPFDMLNPERKSFSNGLITRGGILDDEERTSTNNNIFLATRKEGGDAIEVNNSGMDEFSILGLGNCYVKSYAISCGLGDFPKASVSFSSESFFLTDYSKHSGVQSGISGAMNVPAVSQRDGTPSEHSFVIDDSIYDIHNYSGGVVDPIKLTPNVIEPTNPTTMEIMISGDSIGVLSGNNTENSQCFQSFSMGLNVPRYEHRSLKSKYAHDRFPLFPCEGSVSVSLIVDEFASGDSRFFSNDPFDIAVKLKGNDGAGGYTKDFIRYDIKSAKLESQSFTQGIGGNLVWNANFSFLEGESTDQFDRENHSGTNGLFASGLSDLEESRIIYQDGVGIVQAENAWLDDLFPAYIELD